MLQVSLQAIPNQSLSVRLDDSIYDLRIHALNSFTQDGLVIPPIMVMDITRDNVTILQGQRLVAGFPVIPYGYLEDGNFVMITEDDEYPDYNKFGVDQYLMFATSAELAEIRSGT